MRLAKHRQKSGIIGISMALALFVSGAGSLGAQEEKILLSALLPDIEGMVLTESPDTYFPETLFEYINGAAEIYLSYEFEELIVAEYKSEHATDSLAVEIYDMGSDKNSFGIYSAERYPDNDFMSIGTQGYMEEGTMNFLVGQYYVKILCFDCEDRSRQWLQNFSEEIVDRVKEKEGFPYMLKAFPEEGLIPNTEKFILRNVMGYKFLHDGYVVSYKKGDLAFDCFVIEAKNPEEASEMLEKYLTAKGADSTHKVSKGFRIKDRYYHNIYLAQVDNAICGVMKIPDGSEAIGESYLEKLIQSLNSR